MSESCPTSHESAPGIRFRVDAAGIVRTALTGRVGFDQMVMHLHARERTGLLGQPQLVDARGATIELSGAEARALAARVRERGRDTPVGPTAVVADSDFMYGLARMYGGFADSGQFAVFRSMEEAEEWIAGRH